MKLWSSIRLISLKSESSLFDDRYWRPWNPNRRRFNSGTLIALAYYHPDFRLNSNFWRLVLGHSLFSFYVWVTKSEKKRKTIPIVFQLLWLFWSSKTCVWWSTRSGGFASDDDLISSFKFSHSCLLLISSDNSYLFLWMFVIIINFLLFVFVTLERCPKIFICKTCSWQYFMTQLVYLPIKVLFYFVWIIDFNSSQDITWK